MIFMSQSGLRDPTNYPAWGAWYVEHLHSMLTVPGVSSAQRFLNEQAGYPPSLAMYTFDSAAVFAEAQYQRIRGLGAWAERIDRSHYHRNLFSGLDDAPKVGQGEALLVADRPEPDGTLKAPMRWLKAVDVDISTAYRGIAVIPSDEAICFAGEAVGIYRPTTPRFEGAINSLAAAWKSANV